MLYAVGTYLDVPFAETEAGETAFSSDMSAVIADFKETLTVKRLFVTYDGEGKAVENWVTIGTFEGDWQPASGTTVRQEQGLEVKSQAFVIAGITADVEENDKIYRSNGRFMYVNYVKRYSGHLTVMLTRNAKSL